MRPIAAVAIFIMWMKFFYFLRLFKTTAPIVRMIMQIISDMTTFSFVLTIAVVGFANTFYILSLNGVDYKACQPEDFEGLSIEDIEKLSAKCTPLTGTSFFTAIIYSFRTGLGDFDTNGYDNIAASQMIWIFFIACAILIQIILLNMLIAIMGDTFSRVTEIGEVLKLREMSAMISDNEFLLDRTKVFKNSKFIVIAKAEKAG